MSQLEAIYKDYSACCEDFSSGVDCLKQRILMPALDYFKQACDSVSDDHPHRAVYLSYYGYARILNGEDSGIALCRQAARSRHCDADVLYILARAEGFCNNRKHMMLAIEQGMKINRQHQGLRLMRQRVGYRKSNPIPFLSRRHPLNRLIGPLLRKNRR